MKAPIENKKYVRLGRPNVSDLSITLFAPLQVRPKSIECRVYDNSSMVFSGLAEWSDEDFGDYTWHVEKLESGKTYTFSFFSANEPVQLADFKDADLKFTYLPFGVLKNPFLFSSCHGIEYADKLEPWAMIERMYSRVSSPTNKVSDYLRAGDQYYLDKVAAKHIPLLKDGVTPKKIRSLRLDIIVKIFEHWENPSMKKLLAQVPSLWIPDDHDFDDGWGSSPLRMTEGSLLPEWDIYRREVTAAYRIVQQAGNPPPLLQKAESAFSWALESRCSRPITTCARWL